APRTLLGDDPVRMGEAGGAGAGEKGAGLVLVPVERLFAGGGTTYHDAGLKRARPAPVARLHPEDGARLGLQTGDAVALTVGKAELNLQVELTDKVPVGTVQVPMGLPEAPVNQLGSAGRYPSVALHKRVLEEVG